MDSELWQTTSRRRSSNWGNRKYFYFYFILIGGFWSITSYSQKVEWYGLQEIILFCFYRWFLIYHMLLSGGVIQGSWTYSVFIFIDNFYSITSCSWNQVIEGNGNYFVYYFHRWILRRRSKTENRNFVYLFLIFYRWILNYDKLLQEGGVVIGGTGNIFIFILY